MLRIDYIKEISLDIKLFTISQINMWMKIIKNTYEDVHF